MLNFKFHVKNYSIFTFQEKEYWLFTRKIWPKNMANHVSRNTLYLPPQWMLRRALMPMEGFYGLCSSRCKALCLSPLTDHKLIHDKMNGHWFFLHASSKKRNCLASPFDTAFEMQSFFSRRGGEGNFNRRVTWVCHLTSEIAP